jgi:transglutaminase-like putative cysteine protease
VLHFAWGAARSWSELGSLYHELLQRTPTAPNEIERQAHALIAGGLEHGSDRLDRLLDFVESEIRNVGVELREGWYLPDSPSTVLARGWGDCKDKALLLARLLEAAGIEAYPALIDSRPGGHFDPAFPRLSAFDHLIVAVAERSLGDGGGEQGWVFLDPTLPVSDGRPLRPRVEGRYALVLRDGDRSSLEIVTALRDSNAPSGDDRRERAELPP